jgi:CDP-glucose 4,6-dehydratase
MNKSFWKNKKVLVTGHTGFKGGWLTLVLLRLGAKVFGLSLREKQKSFFSLCKIKNKISKNFYCNINNYSKFKKIIKKNDPEIVFHLAAQPIVLESFANPISTLNTNIIGTANLLNSLRFTKKIKSIVIVTSDKCYENVNKKAYLEDDKLGGSDIYSASKSSSELITTAFRRSFFSNSKANIATARAGNVIGGGDFAKNRIFPDIIKSYEKKKQCIIRNPSHTRPWQHVLDPISGYLTLAEKLYKSKNEKYNSAWNFGPPNENKSVKDIVDFIKGSIPLKIKKNNNKNRFNESKYLNLNSNKSKKYLNWNRALNFQRSIKMTLEWYLNSKKNKDNFEFTMKQIDEYLERYKK